MIKRILLGILMMPMLALAQTYPSPTFNNLTVNGTFTAVSKIGLGNLAVQGANTIVGNASASSGSPAAISISGCNGAAQALQWTSGSGFGCNSGIATAGANANITSLSGLSTPLSISQGGTGASTQAGAFSNILASSTVPVANGGTGRTGLGSHAVLVGNGTTAVSLIAPVSAGYVLTDNGPGSDPSFQPGNSGRLIGIQVFTSSGTYTPTAGTNSVIVEIIGGGGGGGGASSTTSGQFSGGQGGGAGAYAKGRITSAFSGVTVTIGSGGTGGTAGPNAGGSGGTSSFGALITAPGGTGGSGSGAATSPFVVGTAANSTPASGASIFNGIGASGFQALLMSTTNIVTGRGAPTNFGSGALSVYGQGTGANAVSYGSGGSGGGSVSGGAATAGGNGAAGICIVQEFS